MRRCIFIMLLAIILGPSTDASATLIDRGGGLVYDTDTKGTTGIHSAWAVRDGDVAPVANFTADNTIGDVPLTVNFTDESTGTIDTWEWDFGDNSTSTAQNPSHVYNDPGTISLTITGYEGSDTETKSDYIKVSYPSKAMPWIPLLLLDDAGSGGQSITGSVLYFEPDRELQTTELNGKVFDSGFSFSGWFNLTRMPAGSGDIMGFSYDDFWVTLQGDGSVNIHLKYTSTNITGLATQEWNNLAVTYDLSTVNFYLNGTLVRIAEASGPVEFPDNESITFTIGDFYGYATQIKIWKRGLSAEELNMEINQADSSNSEGIEHQWLFDEGTGIQASDSVGGVDFKIRTPYTPYWIDLDGPYEIDHDSMFRVTSESKLLPIPHAFGSADLNQDGHPDLFYHGGFGGEPIHKTPLLALQNDGAGNLSDGSDSLIDGGLYYKVYPSGRETIVADLNNDGYEDVFIGQSGQHGDVEGSEANCLLLSNGKSGIYPSESTIISPPCTLDEPAFSGQKPCSSDSEGNIYYPDNSAPLVPIDIRSNNHGSTAGDIDNDGDMDIFVGSFLPGHDTPVQPYFLLNDGNGNFTANWQMVPNKAFHTETYMNESFQQLDEVYTIWRLEDLDGDGFLDLVMIGGCSDLAEHQPSDPFDVEQVYWDASVHDLVAWGTDSGIGESYTILDKDPLFVAIHLTPITADIDMDGDIDIIATKQDSNNAGQYLQVFANNGNRIFTDVTQQSIPQDREIAQTLSLCSGEMREIDFNGDKCPDFYQQSFGLDNDFSDLPHIMWLNNCKGYFTPIEHRFVGKIGLMIPLDVDGDGDIDFVSQTSGQDSNGYNYLEHTLLRCTKDINIDKYIDTDRDGLRDQDDIDDDNDGVNDSEDAFPKDQYRQ